MLQVALVFLWLVCGLFMADLGIIYMMVLKNYLQHEKQKKGKAEKQESRQAQQHRNWKRRKAKKQRAEKQRSWTSRKAWKQQSGEAERQHSGEAEHQKSGKAEKQRTTKQKSREKQKSKMNKEGGKQKSQKETPKTENMPSPSKICLKPCQLMSPPGTSGALCGTCSNIV